MTKEEIEEMRAIEEEVAPQWRYLHWIFPSLRYWAEWYNEWSWRRRIIDPDDEEECKEMIKEEGVFVLGYDGRVYELAWNKWLADAYRKAGIKI